MTNQPASDIATRIDQLDSLGAILPQDRAEQLASLLSDEDIETLRHLAKEGMGENSLRALMSDLGYLEGWAIAATGAPLPWPVPASLLLKFIAHHLWDKERKMSEPAHGMPDEMADSLRRQGLLRSSGPHAPATVQRRLAHWSTLHRWRGLEGPFGSPEIRAALRLAVRVADRPRGRKSQKAITLDILERLLATCDGGRLRQPDLADLRDRALLLTGFASGGRRRSELASLRFSQLTFEEAIPSDPNDPNSPLLPAASLLLGRTKTEGAEDDNEVLLLGRPVAALRLWLEATKIKDGALFRAIDRWGNLKPRSLTAQSVNGIIKQRCALAGLNPDDYSAHGLRSGFLTEAANQGIPLPDAMQQSRHRSLAQASRYYNEANRSRRRSARIVG